MVTGTGAQVATAALVGFPTAFEHFAVIDLYVPAAEMAARNNGQIEAPLETQMSMLRKTSAIAFVIAMVGATAHAQAKQVAKDIVIVHGALVDASGWRAVHDILLKDGYHVTIVQEPLTGLAEDVDATKRVLDQQTGPVVLVGHSYAGSVITEAGADPKVGALVYVAALQPDAGEAGGQLMAKFAAPNDAMRAATNRTKPEKYFFIPPAKFRAVYAADVPAAEAQFLADSQQQLAEKALEAPVSVAAWRSKPSYAILTTRDHLISPELQRWMYQRAGDKVTEVSASHAVFISQPEAVARVIEAAAN
jgi:pimeloyl-ACP methyl ester carboxylesterase